MEGVSNSNLVSHSSRAWKFKMKVLEKLVSPSFSAPAAESHLLTALLSHIHPFLCTHPLLSPVVYLICFSYKDTRQTEIEPF